MVVGQAHRLTFLYNYLTFFCNISQQPAKGFPLNGKYNFPNMLVGLQTAVCVDYAAKRECSAHHRPKFSAFNTGFHKRNSCLLSGIIQKQITDTVSLDRKHFY